MQRRLSGESTARQLERFGLSHRQLVKRLRRGINQRLDKERAELSHLARDLYTLSPLNTLGRGYAIVCHASDDRIVRSSNEVACGERVKARLSQGGLGCEVVEVENPIPEGE